MSVESSLLPASHPFTQQETKHFSKRILRSALQKANVAVQCDSTNDVLGAVHAYTEAIELLEKVLNLIEKDNDKKRLQEIHDSYSERIRLLTAIVIEEGKEKEIQPIEKGDDEDSEDSEDSEVSDDDWETKPTLQKATVRKIISTEFNRNMTTSSSSFSMHSSKSTPTTQQQQQQSHADNEDYDLDSDIEAKQMPAMTLPSLKKKEEELSPSSPATPTAIAYIRPYRTRTSSLPKVPRSSSMSTVESLDEEQQPTKVRTSAIGSMRKKTVNRLSVEGLVGRKSAGYTHSTGSPSFGHFLKDQTQDTEEVKEHQQLKLLLALEKSMQQGAYVTKKLYIPKSLWQQHNVKLSFVDIKISACETLANDLHRLENWAYLDDLLSSLRLLEHVETSVESLKTNLSKKFKRESTNGGNQTSSAGHTNGTTKIETTKKSSQSFMSWGTKLTKSVERMNAFSLTKG
ncbi:hypothetical protein RMATCC62417_05696 [Rhizopus microsporus]|nr:hypothetical protein RMATCC62417_05696 [Rhizopus microsporus]